MTVKAQRTPRASFHHFKTILSTLGVFAALVLILLIAVNWPAVVQTTHYALTAPQATELPLFQAEEPTAEPDSLTIAKLSIKAPILWNQSLEEIPGALSHGIAHLEGTVNPGEQGNSVFIGHSSDYSWKRNPYAAVFALLPHIKTGDTIQVVRNGKVYPYTVNGQKVVSANDLEVLAPTSTATLTLLTCYPIGTTWKRYIVTATYTGTAKPPTSEERPAANLSDLNLR